jgi:hypothetical protein
MSKTNETNDSVVEQPTIEQLVQRIVQLEEQVAEITKPKATQQREMTDADAKAILTGEHKSLKHNEAAAKLGLSYGQVYSCRLEYTFRHIHKELHADPAYKNSWKK